MNIFVNKTITFFRAYKQTVANQTDERYPKGMERQNYQGKRWKIDPLRTRQRNQISHLTINEILDNSFSNLPTRHCED